MRRASIVFLLALTACGGHGSSGDDDANMGDDGNGGDDDGSNRMPMNVTLTLNNKPNNAAMFSFIVAYQDGSGAWMLAPAPTGDTYTLPIYSSVYSIAFTCITGTANGTAVQSRTVTTASWSIAERTSLVFDVPPRCSDRNPATVSLHGTISSSNFGGSYVVRWGDRVAVANSQNQWAMEVPPGTHDLVVLHNGGIVQIGADYIVDDALIQRGLVVSSATTANVDFDTSESVLQYGVSIPIGSGRRVAQTTFYTAGGTTGQLVTDASSPWETEAFATDQQVAGDVYDQQMSIAVAGQTAIETRATADPADQTWVTPAALGATSSSSMTAPYPRITTTWPMYAESVGYTWFAAQAPSVGQCGTAACQIVWAAQMSPGVLGMMPTYTMPDLSALTGWTAALQLVPGVLAGGSVSAQTSSAGAADFPPPAPPTDGTLRVFVRSDYTVTP